jgi:hypothetical protein
VKIQLRVEVPEALVQDHLAVALIHRLVAVLIQVHLTTTMNLQDPGLVVILVRFHGAQEVHRFWIDGVLQGKNEACFLLL